ncbi:hypothetical protein [Paracidovorax citrulli]
MPANYPAPSIFLEVLLSADSGAELRLPCDAVTVGRDTIVVRGIGTRHLSALRWIPDSLSFQSYQHRPQFPVPRHSAIDGLTARFPLRQPGGHHGAAE